MAWLAALRPHMYLNLVPTTFLKKLVRICALCAPVTVRRVAVLCAHGSSSTPARLLPCLLTPLTSGSTDRRGRRGRREIIHDLMRADAISISFVALVLLLPPSSRHSRSSLLLTAAAAGPLHLGTDDGILDVTEPPFRVDNSGGSDTTAALQAAIDFAHNETLVAYFPAGDYLISDTIRCFETFYWHTEDNNTWPSRFTPHVLVGQHTAGGRAAGRLPRRPRIVLGEASAGFGDTSQLKNVVHFNAISYDPNNTQAEVGQHQTNVNFNQLFRGIDIEIRRGNPGAVGIFHQDRPCRIARS